MSDLKEIRRIIETNRPKLSKNSVNTYVSIINKITDNNPKLIFNNSNDFIKHMKAVTDYLKTFKPSLRKTKLAAIVVILDDKHNPHSKELTYALRKYRVQMTKDIAYTEKEEMQQELSQSQKENFIPWTQVLKVYDQLKLETGPYFKLDKLTQRQFSRLQDFVILSCYVLAEPRRSEDYINLKIRNTDNDDECNYLAKVPGRGNRVKFVFNNYKNAGKLGPQEVEVPQDLKTIITKWAKINTHDYLIVSTTGTKINQSRLTIILNHIFGGLKISSSMLRHIYLTYKFGDINLQQLQRTTTAMGNSEISRTLKYVQKDAGKLKQ